MRTYSLFLPLKEHTKTSWFTCLQEVPLRLPHRPHSTTRGGWKPAPLHECGHRRDSGHCALPVLHAVPPRVPAPQHVLPNAHEDGGELWRGGEVVSVQQHVFPNAQEVGYA
eukprot:scaffold18144_cov21-Tisochrysis_lutea.AAC.1